MLIPPPHLMPLSISMAMGLPHPPPQHTQSYQPMAAVVPEAPEYAHYRLISMFQSINCDVPQRIFWCMKF